MRNIISALVLSSIGLAAPLVHADEAKPAAAPAASSDKAAPASKDGKATKKSSKTVKSSTSSEKPAAQPRRVKVIRHSKAPTMAKTSSSVAK